MPENKISPVFTENELKNIAVDSMGKASEAGAAAVRIFGLATNTKANGEIIYTANNKSSATIGFFQWDIGAKENGQEFIDAYNKWANVHDKANIITKDEMPEVLLRLHQNRDTALPLIKMDIRKDELGEKFNTFFASRDGEQFIMELQKQQYDEKLKGSMDRALNSASVQVMNKEDAQVVLACIAKVRNQRGSVPSEIHKLLEDPTNLLTKDEFIAQLRSHSKISSVVRDSIDATIKGATLHNKLTSDNGSLGEIYKDHLTRDPFVIDEVIGNLPEEQLIDTMFRYPDKATQLINSLNKNNNLIINPTTWNKSALEDLKNEVYTIGVKDGVLFSIDKDGHAHRMDDKG